MKQFRLPRKVKKSLKGHLWLYPADEKGNSLMASPSRHQEDYIALKNGIVRNLINTKDAKARRKISREKLDKEVFVSDEELKRFVNDIFREDVRTSSYNILIEAKNSPKAISAYYNFVNAYRLHEGGDETYGNVCCLAIDNAKQLLKGKKRK